MDPRALLRRYNIRPRHRLGQNFLTNSRALEATLEAAAVSKADCILEIGPGTGALTAELAAHAGCVVAVELDRELVMVLRAELGSLPNLQVLQGDILSLAPMEELAGRCRGCQSYKVVANLPYYITSHVLRRLLEAEPRAKSITVMVQKEVAQRAAASPPDMSLLGVSIQYYSVPRIVTTVPAEAFVPRPDVDSAVLHLDCRVTPLFPGIQTERYFRIVAAAFGQKRKNILNSLSSNLRLDKEIVARALDEARVDPTARAQTLTLEDWARICETLPEV